MFINQDACDDGTIYLEGSHIVYILDNSINKNMEY
jgi:hypothetical protein